MLNGGSVFITNNMACLYQGTGYEKNCNIYYFGDAFLRSGIFQKESQIPNYDCFSIQIKHVQYDAVFLWVSEWHIQLKIGGISAGYPWCS